MVNGASLSRRRLETHQPVWANKIRLKKYQHKFDRAGSFALKPNPFSWNSKQRRQEAKRRKVRRSKRLSPKSTKRITGQGVNISAANHFPPCGFAP
jgi:hypothetical protein